MVELDQCGKIRREISIRELVTMIRFLRSSPTSFWYGSKTSISTLIRCKVHARDCEPELGRILCFGFMYCIIFRPVLLIDFLLWQAYRHPKPASVQIAKIVAGTIIISSLLLGSFILAASYVQARAGCHQLDQLDAMLEKELALEARQMQADALIQVNFWFLNYVTHLYNLCVSQLWNLRVMFIIPFYFFSIDEYLQGFSREYVIPFFRSSFVFFDGLHARGKNRQMWKNTRIITVHDDMKQWNHTII